MVLGPLEDSQVQARGVVIARIVSTIRGGRKNVSTELGSTGRAEFGTRRLYVTWENRMREWNCARKERNLNGNTTSSTEKKD